MVKSYSENKEQRETAKSANLKEGNHPRDKEKINENNFESRIKSQNKIFYAQDQRFFFQKRSRTSSDLSSKSFGSQQQTQQEPVSNYPSRGQFLSSELKSERVCSALIRSTPHIKFNGSLYDNHIILVLPSSLFWAWLTNLKIQNDVPKKAAQRITKCTIELLKDIVSYIE